MQPEFDIAAQDSSSRSRSTSSRLGSSESNSKTTSLRAYKVLRPITVLRALYPTAGSPRPGLKAPKNCPVTSSSLPCFVSFGLIKVSLGSCHFFLPGETEETDPCSSEQFDSCECFFIFASFLNGVRDPPFFDLSLYLTLRLKYANKRL